MNQLLIREKVNQRSAAARGVRVLLWGGDEDVEGDWGGERGDRVVENVREEVRREWGGEGGGVLVGRTTWEILDGSDQKKNFSGL